MRYSVNRRTSIRGINVAKLWGRAANGTVLPIDEVAQSAGTVGYELMCAVAPRVPFSPLASTIG